MYDIGMDELRRYDRFSVEGINCAILSATEVEILNMSLGGIALLANGRLDMGKEYTLKLEEGGRICAIRGTIVWSVLSGTRRNSRGEMVPLYKAGLRFKDVQSEKMNEILDFIEHHKRSPEQRLIMRFDVRSPEKATLNASERYRVQKVSLSGLLLESGQPFLVEQVLAMELAIGEGRILSFRGRIASCVEFEGGREPSYQVGIEFLELPETSREALRKFINSL